MFSILQSIQMLKRNSIIRLFPVIAIIVLSSTSISFAQNETGQRPCNPAALKFSRVWYPNYSMYQMKYPILRSVPPIETGMPLNILFSYIYMDSLLRTAKPQDFRKRLVQWQTMNDTLRYMVQALNTLKDYDPIRYNQYRIETALQIKRSGGMRLTPDSPTMIDSALLAENTPVHYPERYESTVFATEGSILTRFQRTYVGTDYEAMKDVLCSDYVLRATVISIDSMPSKYHLNEPQRGIFEYRVTIAVTDTLKGKVLKPLDVSTLNIPSKPKNRTADGTQYYQFQYSTSHKSHDGYISPLLTDQSGRFIITPGQDIIVFLGFYDFLLDCEYDYYDLALQQQCKSFILPVINNTVIDGGHIWSDSDTMSYPAWKQKFNTIMQKFSTRNF